MANVRAYIDFSARVCVVNATSGPKEGKQWHKMINGRTGIMSESEWRWRLAAAENLILNGSTTYLTYGAAVGAGWK